MTTTFMEPETIEVPIQLIYPEGTGNCVAGYAWCVGECTEDDPYHRGHYATLGASLLRNGREWVEDDVTLLVRLDENEEQPVPLILVNDGPTAFTARQGRIAAAHLLNAADDLDPLPTGVVVTTAVKLRIGDELLTEDGWQQVTGLMFFAEDEGVYVFTPERHPDTGDGWDFSFNDPVKVRRHLTGSCAIQFVEPVR